MTDWKRIQSRLHIYKKGVSRTQIKERDMATISETDLKQSSSLDQHKKLISRKLAHPIFSPSITSLRSKDSSLSKKSFRRLVRKIRSTSTLSIKHSSRSIRKTAIRIKTHRKESRDSGTMEPFEADKLYLIKSINRQGHSGSTPSNKSLEHLEIVRKLNDYPDDDRFMSLDHSSTTDIGYDSDFNKSLHEEQIMEQEEDQENGSKFRLMFLNIFKRIPSISEIRLSEHIVRHEKKKRAKAHTPSPPLEEDDVEEVKTDGLSEFIEESTGESTQFDWRSESFDLSIGEFEEKEESEKHDYETLSFDERQTANKEESESESDWGSYDVDIIKVNELSDKEDNIYQKMLEASVIALDSDDENDINNLTSLDMIRQKINAFLSDIIEKVVIECDMRDSRTDQFLDKDKLYITLRKSLNNFREQQCINKYLATCAAKFLARTSNRVTRAPVNKYYLGRDSLVRFQEAIASLDYWLKRKLQTKKIRDHNIQRHFGEEQELRKHDKELIYHLKDLVMKTICKGENRSARLPKVTTDIIQKMDKLRDELSKVRLQCIMKQHTLAHIEMRMDEIEHITDSKTMTQFLAMQCEVDSISKKLNDRINENERLRQCYNSYIHTLSHLKCRGHLLKRQLDIQNKKLNAYLDKHRVLRDMAYKENQKHNRVYREIEATKEQGGIMHYPKLLMDYDNTIDYIAKKSQFLNGLQTRIEHMSERIERLERNRKCTETKDGKIDSKKKNKYYAAEISIYA